MRTIWLIVGLIIIPQTVLSAEPASADRSLSAAQYRSQEYLYDFLTNQYFSLLESGDGEEEGLRRFLLRLSDMGFAPQETKKKSASVFSLEQRSISGLQSVTFKRGKYEESLLLSDMIGLAEGSLYRKGMTLLNMKWLKEAETVLGQIKPSDENYPYARIALSQIEVRKGNLTEAERYLRELTTDHLARENGLSERVSLLLGRMLYEKKLYPDAFQEFAKIPRGNTLYKDSLIGQAWCLINLGDYGRAALLLEEINADVSANQADQEILMTMGYCYFKSGDSAKSGRHFEELLAAVTLGEKNLSTMIETRSIRKRYLAALLNDDAELLSDGERQYLFYLQKDPNIEKLLNALVQLQKLRKHFEMLEMEITANRIYFENMKAGLNESIKNIEKGLEVLKKQVQTSKIPLQKEIEKGFSEGGGPSDYYGNQIYEEWRRSLERAPAKETKLLIKIILDEWLRDEFNRCYGNPVICYIANFVKPGKNNYTPTQVNNIAAILDLMARDLKNARSGNTSLEEMLAGGRKKVSDQLARNDETAKKLDKIHEEVSNDLKRIEKNEGATLNSLESHILLNLIRARYELGYLRARIDEELKKVKASPDRN